MLVGTHINIVICIFILSLQKVENVLAVVGKFVYFMLVIISISEWLLQSIGCGINDIVLTVVVMWA